jgi:hypothetical protein
MWRSVALILGLCGVLAGCSWGSGRQAEPGSSTSPLAPNTLVTRNSLSGVKLGQSESQVETLTGSGHRVPKQGVKEVIYAVPGGSLTVVYGSLFANKPRPSVLIASTTSPWFRTAEGVGVGSSLAQVEGLGAMNCASTDSRHEQCQTLAYGPGLEFDLVDRRVARVSLVRRVN